jgi:hypothetical protein
VFDPKVAGQSSERFTRTVLTAGGLWLKTDHLLGACYRRQAAIQTDARADIEHSLALKRYISDELANLKREIPILEEETGLAKPLAVSPDCVVRNPNAMSAHSSYHRLVRIAE